jgi:solute carrier family 25 folate transporter 32
VLTALSLFFFFILTMSLDRQTSPPPGSLHYSSQIASASSSENKDPMAERPTPLERFVASRSQHAINAFAGAAGGFTSGVVTCPLDVIKTKLQAQGAWRIRYPEGAVRQAAIYRGMHGTARLIWKEEGLKGMYRGLGPIILGYLPTWAVWFTVYGRAKIFFAERSGKSCICYSFAC